MQHGPEMVNQQIIDARFLQGGGRLSPALRRKNKPLPWNNLGRCLSVGGNVYYHQSPHGDRCVETISRRAVSMHTPHRAIDTSCCQQLLLRSQFPASQQVQCGIHSTPFHRQKPTSCVTSIGNSPACRQDRYPPRSSSAV